MCLPALFAVNFSLATKSMQHRDYFAAMRRDMKEVPDVMHDEFWNPTSHTWTWRSTRAQILIQPIPWSQVIISDWFSVRIVHFQLHKSVVEAGDASVMPYGHRWLYKTHLYHTCMWNAQLASLLNQFSAEFSKHNPHPTLINPSSFMLSCSPQLYAPLLNIYPTC